MKLVAFDTSTEACSVAVQIDGEVRNDHRLVQREHAALLLSMVQGLLEEFAIKPKELDGVIFGQGPGSFTGVRIAAAAAQGLAVAANCGVQGVSSLQAMASACVRECHDRLDGTEWVVAALDARMDQIYANCYQAQRAVQALGDEVVVNADDFNLPRTHDDTASELNPTTVGSERLVRKLLLCGSGAERYQSELAQRCNALGEFDLNFVSSVYPNALDLLRLAESGESTQWLSAQEAQPVYLRNKVALTEAERLSS